MTLSDLSSIVGVISRLAVLGSLVYLSLQVKQSEKNQRALMNQGIVTRTTDMLMYFSQPFERSIRSRIVEGETVKSRPIVTPPITARNALHLLRNS